MRRSSVAILVALVAAIAPACASAAPPVEVGIGDQKAEMFTDPLFLSLGITKARIVVPWDVLSSDWQTADLDAWMHGALDAGVRPLVTFGHSRVESRRRVAPSPDHLRRVFLALHARYPWVHEYATWNEPNHCGEPLCHRPALAARYFDTLRRACPSCRIVAAEVLDMPNMASWVRRFQRAVRGPKPRLWGLHNYVDANRLRTTGTRTLLRITKGPVWFTETGGIVRRLNRHKVSFPESVSHAATAVRWIFTRLAPLSPRVQRVYLYHWNVASTTDSWDSALIGPDGVPRPALRVVRRAIDASARAFARLRARRSAARSATRSHRRVSARRR